MKKWILCCLIFVLTTSTVAQITWTTLPRDFQFVPRNIITNKGKLIFEGTVTQPGFTTVVITHTGAAGSIVKYTIPLTYNGSGQANIYQAVYIQAGKINHSIEITINNSSGSMVLSTIKRIACGDAYLISGQSNSVANSYNGLSNPVYADSFIRSYGSSSPGVAGALNDTGWYIANGDGLYNKGCIGQWGLVFARRILDSTGIPVCIINAGVGGTPITFHQKNTLNPEDLNSNYGRLLYRAKKAGVYDRLRGIMWFQGESDGSLANLHDSLFRKMHADWFRDFPGLERVAVVQVRSGCGGPTLELREKQRLLKNLNRTHVLSANGLNKHDGCHYWFKDGYETLGILLFQQLKTALYGLKSNPENQPLNPHLVYFGNSTKTELCVEFTPLNATLKTDVGFHRLFSIVGGTSAITGGYVKNNKIYLSLSGSGCDVKALNYDGLAGQQPWVKTTEDATLISFYRFPVISVKPLPNLTICKGETVQLGTDSIFGTTYSWKGVLSGLTSSLAKPKFVVPRSEKFVCIMKSVATGCIYDTISQNVVVDTITPALFPHFVYVCMNDSVTLGDKKTDWQKGTWTYNGKQFSGFTVRTSDTGIWIFKAVSSSGCTTTDTVFLKNYPNVKKFLPSSLEICKGQEKILKAPNGSSAWIWNQIPGYDSLVVSSVSRNVNLQYKDSNGCNQSDSTMVTELVTGSVQLADTYAFCPGDTLFINRPLSFVSWVIDSVSQPEAIYKVLREGNHNIILIDKNECTAKHKLQALWHPVNKLDFTDKRICNDDSVIVLAPGWIATWRWNGLTFKDRVVLKKDGVYDVQWQDSNQCKGEQTFLLETAQKPIFNLPADTFYCRGDSLKIDNISSDGSFVFFNGNLLSQPLFIKNTGKFVFSAYNKPYCADTHELYVQEKICVSKTTALANIPFSTARIPGGLQILASQGKAVDYCVLSAGGQMLVQGRIKAGKNVVIPLTSGIYVVGFRNLPILQYQFFKTAVY